jgi:ribose transport system permease protein
MNQARRHGTLSRILSDYGMAGVLLLLCIALSVLTIAWQDPEGTSGGEQLANLLLQRKPTGGRVLIAVGSTTQDLAFAQSLARRLVSGGFKIVAVVQGKPGDARDALERLVGIRGDPQRPLAKGEGLDAIAATVETARWGVFEDLPREFPALGDVPVVTAPQYRWPNFLKSSNLANICSQIAVIAILAVGMTLVIITGGIDLSVGSLIALSAVTATWLIREVAGAESASTGGVIASCLAAIALCACVGLFSGSIVTLFRVPPFIVTLAIMLMANGLAFIIADGKPISQVPKGFIWLGGEASLFGIPNSVVLMLLLYAIAHIVMTRMTLGRYIYAVGGNREAARLSGVPVRRVLLFVYTLSGALAGLGGVVMASQLTSGSYTYGDKYELSVIAAVVIGGTSLSGGEGKVLGTLIGAFLIAVIGNGMNLVNMNSIKQRVVLGAVILGAAILDSIKKHGLPRRGET